MKEAELTSKTVFLTKNDRKKIFQNIWAMEQIRNTQQWSNWEASVL
jgi:hypothetical protein